MRCDDVRRTVYLFLDGFLDEPGRQDREDRGAQPSRAVVRVVLVDVPQFGERLRAAHLGGIRNSRLGAEDPQI